GAGDEPRDQVARERHGFDGTLQPHASRRTEQHRAHHRSGQRGDLRSGNTVPSEYGTAPGRSRPTTASARCRRRAAPEPVSGGTTAQRGRPEGEQRERKPDDDGDVAG